MSLGSLPKPNLSLPVPQAVFTQKQNIVADGPLAVNQEVDQKAKILKVQADAIDAYFKAHDMPLEGYGMKMAKAADEEGLDWRLLPGISVVETSGGENLCKSSKGKNNPFGFGSCHIGFDSFDEAIDTVARHLGGDMESTALHYAGKNTEEILKEYNPPSIVHDYAHRVMSVMKDIGDEDVTVPTNA